MDWKLYALAIRLFNGLGLRVVSASQWLQGRLSLNPQGFSAVTPEAPFHTAVRLASNTKEREEERSMADSRPIVLIIDDEPQMRRFLRAILKASGYRLVEASTAQEGLAYAATRQPEVILLDLGLPDLDGLEVIRRLREWTTIPIVVLSARKLEADKVAAFDAGVDDYLTKPFGVSELLARIRVALRHGLRASEEPDEPVFCVGDLRVDLARRQVYVTDQEVHLTPIEYTLLTTLVRYAGKVVTHRQLLREVWGLDSTDTTYSLRVYIGQLRHKLEADPARPRYLVTEQGVGYRLKTT